MLDVLPPDGHPAHFPLTTATIPTMDLRQLGYFLAIVEHGGVHRAAESLHIAQSSLSQTMRRLEKDLGVELFHRVGRGIVLSPAGEALVGPARTVLREADQARLATRDVAELRAGSLDIMSLPDLAVDPVATWLARFLQVYPDVKARVTQDIDPSIIFDSVRNGSSDIGFACTPAGPDLTSTKLVEQRFVLVGPPEVEDEWPDPMPVAQLSGLRLILAQRGTATRDAIEAALLSQGVEPRVGVEIQQREAVVPLVLAGAGVGLLPLRVGLSARERGAVVRELDPTPRIRVFCIRRSGKQSPALREFSRITMKSIKHWVDAVERRQDAGDSLLDAAAASLHEGAHWVL